MNSGQARSGAIQSGRRLRFTASPIVLPLKNYHNREDFLDADERGFTLILLLSAFIRANTCGAVLPSASNKFGCGGAAVCYNRLVITKRQLGFMLIAIGVMVVAGAFAANFIGARDAGFGPLQKIGLALGGGLILIALPLLRLGDRPA